MAYSTPSPGRYRGDEILTVSSSAVALASVPTTANYVMFRVLNNDVRMRGDGTDPTAAAGQLIKANEIFEWPGDPTVLKFIATGSDASLDVAYYRV